MRCSMRPFRRALDCGERVPMPPKDSFRRALLYSPEVEQGTALPADLARWRRIVPNGNTGWQLASRRHRPPAGSGRELVGVQNVDGPLRKVYSRREFDSTEILPSARSTAS